jgi:hypothetical protein
MAALSRKGGSGSRGPVLTWLEQLLRDWDERREREREAAPAAAALTHEGPALGEQPGTSRI